MKSKIKNSYGITLIALVVTIVVLLILAGVSIQMLAGEDGIIKQAIDAKNKTDESSAREEVELAYVDALSKQYINVDDTIPNIMTKNLQQQDEDAWVVGNDDEIEAHYKGYTFILENGKVASSEKDTSSTNTIQVSDVNPGDITTDSEGNALSGTESNPYQINSIEDLVALADNIDAGCSTDYYFKLEETLNFSLSKSYADSTRTSLTTTLINGGTVTHSYTTNIKNDLTSNSGWKPMGTTDYSFEGTFDGNGNQINNIYINYIEENETYVGVGLFAYNSGIIQNLTLSGNITGTMKATYEATGYTWIEMNIGAIAGDNNGTIDNCNSKVTVTGIEAGGYENAIYVGGIVGYNEGCITNSSNSGAITGKSNNQTYLYTWIDVAGIAGDGFGGSIENCYNIGNVSGTNFYEGTIAGIVGHSDGTIVSKCYNSGNIKAQNIVNFIQVGGIVGENFTDVTNCYNIGSISNISTNNFLAGGIIGHESFLGTINKNYDGTGIGAIGGQDFIGIAEYASLTKENIINYINSGTTPSSKTQTYAISEQLKPGVYVSYDTSSLSNLTINSEQSGWAYTQTVKPSSYTGGWQVLSNDGTTVELISSDLVTITNTNTTNTNLLYLSGETGYKNAVKTLNTVAGAFLNTSLAENVRSAGATSSSLDTITKTLTYKPTNYTELTDMEFYKDFANMCVSGTATATSGNCCWLASRGCGCDSGWCHFGVRSAGGPAGWGWGGIVYISPGGSTSSNSFNLGVRPIVSLKSTLKVTGGSGSQEDPYTLGL